MTKQAKLQELNCWPESYIDMKFGMVINCRHKILKSGGGTRRGDGNNQKKKKRDTKI